jgi:glycosyltransferase involved in cell wall biosynthesis
VRLHLVALAHTRTTRDFSNCAFTELARKMADMMSARGHEVILYGGEENDAKVSEFVTCISKTEQAELCGVRGPEDVLRADWDPNSPHWALFNRRVIEELRVRLGGNEIVLLSQGQSLQPTIDALPHHLKCEYAVGYAGWSETTHRVMPSHAWMHALYGRWYGCHGTRGRFYDRVIPHYFDPEDFPMKTRAGGDYLLFVGRLNEDKGVQIAIDAAKDARARLVVAGQGDFPLPDWVEYRGLVGAKERGRLMAGAAAILAPSLYLEPFGKVAVEAQMCGTPVIATDWGGFSETVVDGVTGALCHTMRDFAMAAKLAIYGKYDSRMIRDTALARFSMNVIGRRYETYFHELEELTGRDGWYSGVTR